jgi:glutamine amidotransferase-like uncharacterized protein
VLQLYYKLKEFLPINNSVAKNIALFRHHPECSQDCCDGMIQSLSSKYNITLFSENELNQDLLDKTDIIAFPGGIGDSESYNNFFKRKKENLVADFVANGGYYLGICMGAYWAGSHYFDILDDVDAVQYINRPKADIRRSFSTVANVNWHGQQEKMFFYDGCALVGNTNKFKTIATYANGDAMAIIQNRIGIIGCHPESQEYWYEKPRQYIKEYWHQGHHHNLLLEFVDELVQSQPPVSPNVNLAISASSASLK